jgi:hypothetical protein
LFGCLQAETSSVYPYEMDTMFGEAVLFKVTKKTAESFNGDPSYEVVDMLANPLILDEFFEHYMPNYGSIDLFANNLSPFEVNDASSSSEYESVTQKLVTLDSKQKVEANCEEFDSNHSGKRPKLM